jgi:hypothetical protein
VVGYVALFFALSGAAYAVSTAPRNSVVSKSIKNRQVKTADIAPGSLTTGKFADTAVAPDAEKVGGYPIDSLQRRVAGSCSAGRAISAITASGDVSCSSQVLEITATPGAPGYKFDQLDPTNLELITSCHDPGTFVRFHNLGAGAATLNWIFSQGGTSSTVNATGDVLGPNAGLSFTFPGGRLEGQWIFADGAGVTTVNLHAYDGGSGCEVRGTAVFAPST